MDRLAEASLATWSTSFGDRVSDAVFDERIAAERQLARELWALRRAAPPAPQGVADRSREVPRAVPRRPRKGRCAVCLKVVDRSRTRCRGCAARAAQDCVEALRSGVVSGSVATSPRPP